MVVCKRKRTQKNRTAKIKAAHARTPPHSFDDNTVRMRADNNTNTASIQGGRDALNHGVDGLAIRVDETEVVSDRVKTPQNRVFFHAVALVFAGDPLARFFFELDLILMQ